MFGTHVFWDTQPVQRCYDVVKTPEGEMFNEYVEQKKVSDISEEPLGLPAGYHWCDVDLTNDDELNELYELLKGHYVEDSAGEFRFEYSHAFLRWALNPPGFISNWIVGIRDDTKNNLYAFISGIPVHMTVLGKATVMAEINFLCGHKALREKRLAPTLIQEVTRRVNRMDIWQAIYTAGKTLPTPFATA